MLRTTTATLLLALSITAAEAKCSKASLSGNWVASAGGSGAAITATGGIFDLGGGDTIKVLSLNTTKCTGLIEYRDSGTPAAFGTISTESIASSSSKKPNQVNLNLSEGGLYGLIRLYRQ
jgi:hypothetical protein